MNPTQAIVAALSLDSSDTAILQTALYLARTLLTSLELVHAVRPLFTSVGAGDTIVNPHFSYETTYSDQEAKTAENKLQQLASEIDDVVVNTHILRDYPTEAILTVANEIGAGLIICGVREPTSKHTFLSGLSTGFSLASYSDIPVLLVPDHKPIRFDRPIRILVADNLEAEGLSALNAGFSLARELHAESLIHMHVQEMSLPEIDRMIETVRDSMILGQIPSDPLLSRDYYIDRVRSRTREEMLRRCLELQAESLNSTQYEAVIAFGTPSDEIHQEVQRIETQIMIFGRHHLLRRKTLSLGRIPYHAMIEEGVSTLVVSNSSSRSSALFTTESRGKLL